MADYSNASPAPDPVNSVSFKKGNNITSYTSSSSKSAGDLLLVPSSNNAQVATMFYYDGSNLRNIAPYEYGTSLPTTNNYEGKLFFKII